MSGARFSKQPGMPASPPRVLPPGSCDCHGHIFPPADQYPTVNETMPLAPVDLYLDIHRHLGFERGVLVQGGAYKHDNRAMLDALAKHPRSLRGVALVAGSATASDLGALREQGVRALRFTRGGASRLADLAALAPKLKSARLHVELYVGLEEFARQADSLLEIGVPIVLDHLAGPFDPALGVDHGDFQKLLALLRNGRVWVKLSPQRNSRRFPSYEDVRGHYDLIVKARPDRLVWGSDWPFPHMSEETPAIETLLDIFASWVADRETQRRILADNAAALYDFA